ncbi:MAG: hypothetical protein LBT97_01240 [Planctomycetota bacterium]|jgi:hypothetical protein|nr:hypothetical protein [Planctomycetota bacterium]
MKTTLMPIVLAVLVSILSGRALSAERGYVACVKPGCGYSFAPEDNKAPWWDAVTVGASGGAAAGGAAGAWAGLGTGVVIGGVGGVPGWYVGLGVGALGGGVIGGISGAWYRDRQVMCPRCRTVFKNPRN